MFPNIILPKCTHFGSLYSHLINRASISFVSCTSLHLVNYHCLVRSLFFTVGRVTSSNVGVRHASSSSSFNREKIESYFSAIGGGSDDPPPDLTPEQVTAILRKNELLIFNKQTESENEQFIKKFTDVLKMNKRHTAPLAATERKQLGSLSRRSKMKTGKDSTQHSQSNKLYSLIDNHWVTQVESNQLASNHPIEDRIRVATLNLNSILNPSQNSQPPADMSHTDTCIGFGVFDGHNGGLCADLISRRLFHYIAISLKVLELKQTFGSKLLEKVNPALPSDILQHISTDHNIAPPKFYYNIYTMYEEEIAKRLQTRIEEFEWRALEQYAMDELTLAANEESDPKQEESEERITSAIRRAFKRCDDDLSREIEFNLLNTSSNILLHYYLSLAVSGCCATLVIFYHNKVYVASTGDCRAVMGVLKSEANVSANTNETLTRKILKTVELSYEHNSDNIDELNRLLSEHPKEEQNYIIRENRLLGQLMPLRAFGDFSFKWSTDKMKQLGLTRAFGSHIIPTFYRTPPYLIAEPEVMALNLEDEINDPKHKLLDRFIVLATDGLWEQFDSARKVVKSVNRYRQNVRKQVKAYTSAQVFNIEPAPGSVDDSSTIEESPRSSPNANDALTLGQIIDRLRSRITESPPTTFERITADDDLIEDINCGTFLLRTALSDISGSSMGQTTPVTTTAAGQSEEDEMEDKFSHHVDQYEQQKSRHAKLVSYLTLPQSVVRNFRDDISLIVIGLK